MRRVGPIAWLVAIIIGLGGCASAPTAPPPEGIDQMAPPEILYRAIVSTYNGQKIPIAVASDDYLMVTSEFSNVGPNLRRRTNARVVRAGRGAMGLNVTVQWQRRTTIDGRESWKPVDTAELRKRAKPDELALGRAIEKRFESWKEQWKASKSAPQQPSESH